MAEIKSGLMKGYTGRIGNVIIYQWMGKTIMRQAPGKVRNPKTPKQLEQRLRFKEARLCLNSFKDILKFTWKEKKVGQTAYNNAMSYVMKNVIRIENGKVIKDWTKMRHSHGKLLNVPDMHVRMSEGTDLLFTWDNNAGTGNAEINDLFCFVLRDTKENIVDVRLSDEIRAVRGFVFELPEYWRRKEVTVYGFFMRENWKQVSDDRYVGIVKS